ncbi:MAG: RecQ family ATP-dependent DNA helicase, partial [Bacteroidota bacterium]|nr:RecQ family ATP-dependent DNA helicase [Bacteroidota bacterium]
MDTLPLHILEKYWGYSHFRPLQEDIINSVLAGNDTLALMPTGGGKSICYQVPALMKDGICLVVSPLIALMKDQFEGLQNKGIKALAVFSGMSYREVDVALDNAVMGYYKFLFLSPERLQSDLFLARAPEMKVNLIAVDEAHCISQWGFDFRPSYLKIAEIKTLFPKVPLLALTASATPTVQSDIRERLLFQKGHATFTMSFDRQNLVYAVLNDEDKKSRILKLLEKVAGTALIYVNTRKATHDLAIWLRKSNISADYYHGGLNAEERTQ